MDGALIARKYLLLDSQRQWNDASLYYETTVPIRGRRVDKRSASTISSFRWMRFAYPPYAGTFFICWGDETLNMIVKLVADNRNP
uniref:Uncharacterized protein n=1 Tax=Candidatus Kentrum sp. UNK TaxID=2126344 RepID=A0A451AKR7_9GAMM|nr:MAG: hypothetical protein BECKUNK1418G_GA0071005_11009 [Candidatus Kentron sp. UNK]